jgi:hypothetical protein
LNAISVRSSKEPPAEANPRRRIGFEEAQEIFSHPFYMDQRIEFQEQFRAIGWVRDQLYSLIFEIREDREGEYFHPGDSGESDYAGAETL